MYFYRKQAYLLKVQGSLECCKNCQANFIFQLICLLKLRSIRLRSYHTIYKNDFVLSISAVCGCMRVCDTSLELPRPPYERMIEGYP